MVTGDKGLAGAFNANIVKAASRFLDSKRGKNIEILAIGRKGRDFLRRRFQGGRTEEGRCHLRAADNSGWRAGWRAQQD